MHTFHILIRDGDNARRLFENFDGNELRNFLRDYPTVSAARHADGRNILVAAVMDKHETVDLLCIQMAVETYAN